MWPVLANQNADSPVRTAPFPGMGVGCTTSYVEIRSLATIRMRSPRSYISRTLPLAIRGRSAAAVGGMGRRLAAAPDAAAGSPQPPIPGRRRPATRPPTRRSGTRAPIRTGIELRLSEVVAARSHRSTNRATSAWTAASGYPPVNLSAPGRRVGRNGVAEVGPLGPVQPALERRERGAADEQRQPEQDHAIGEHGGRRGRRRGA